MCEHWTFCMFYSLEHAVNYNNTKVETLSVQIIWRENELLLATADVSDEAFACVF
eukprot:NODE_11616_length_404_cov_2.754930_g10479_i0.p4 GENE.NODE_11616_length_404_cov_2.754930_g10479_i0~~NODE_11616_length_404_cov_2.754930_g10479_i0.p4  ORF type:complete len:55 (-),score=4.47 NODE_11616_length_404_cov_2.754930_g10479_i0:180-344(-)